MDLSLVLRRPVLKAKVNQQINYKAEGTGINSHRGQEFFIL